MTAEHQKSLADFNLATGVGRFRARKAGFKILKMCRGRFREPRPFESYYTETDGCWEWQGSISVYGYGRYAAYHKTWKAHRYAYERSNAVTIPAGISVMHSCDNRKCVNPAHLSLGTHADNVADCVAKGRQARGERKGSARLTAQDVEEIRRIAVKGVRGHEHSWKRLAKRYRVDPTTIRAICQRRTWNHIS